MQLSNEHLTLNINSHGAEMTSLVNHHTGKEYIWQADPQHWNRHAPVLFPIVGRLKNDAYSFQDESFTLRQHGFARNEEFTLHEQTATSLTFELVSSAKLQGIYPFVFRLQLQYDLTETSVKTTYRVFNNGHEKMYFSIGGHPAFNCPMGENELRSDYHLLFDKDTQLSTYLLSGGLFTGETKPIDLKNNSLQITDELFDDDALVFKHLASDRVSLVGPSGKCLTFHFPDFPYLGIWSKSRESPFICIEPWFGLADHVDHRQNITTKEGIMALEAGGRFQCAYTIETH